MVRKLRFSGTPQSVADQLQPYIDRGLEHASRGQLRGARPEWRLGRRACRPKRRFRLLRHHSKAQRGIDVSQLSAVGWPRSGRFVGAVSGQRGSGDGIVVAGQDGDSGAIPPSGPKSRAHPTLPGMTQQPSSWRRHRRLETRLQPPPPTLLAGLPTASHRYAASCTHR